MGGAVVIGADDTLGGDAGDREVMEGVAGVEATADRVGMDGISGRSEKGFPNTLGSPEFP